MPTPPFTPLEWRAIRKRAMVRALELTRNVPKAKELVSAAIAKVLEPDAKPWDPRKHATYDHFLKDRIWSLHGNEIQSFRVVRASFGLELAEEVADLAEMRPDVLLLSAHDDARAARRRAELDRRVKGDTLIELLLEEEPNEAALIASEEGPGNEVPAEEPEQARKTGEPELPPEPVKPPNAEAASTRRAHAAGYTDKEIKNARERLKRHALAVVREERKNEVKS